jgi:hypothetical protein
LCISWGSASLHPAVPDYHPGLTSALENHQKVYRVKGNRVKPTLLACPYRTASGQSIEATSALEQRRRNHPYDFPFFVVAALDANYATKSKLHDFIFFAACDEQGNEFAEKGEVTYDHQVPTGLFERFFRCGDLVLRAKAFALYETIPRSDRPREQFPGLLRARFLTVPNGIDRKLQRTQKIGNVPHFADSFVCQSPLEIFFFGFRFSVLNQIDAHGLLGSFRTAFFFYSHPKTETDSNFGIWA